MGHVPMETHVTIVQADYSNHIKIWSSAQSPFALRQMMAELWDQDADEVCILVGGAFGGKAGIHLTLAALLSKAAGGAG